MSRNPGRAPRALALVLALSACGASRAWPAALPSRPALDDLLVSVSLPAVTASDPADEARARLLASGFQDSIAAALSLAGFRAVAAPVASDRAAAAASGLASGSAWAATSVLGIEDGRLSALVAIYDCPSGALVACERLSTAPGPTALAILDGAARRSVLRLEAFRSWRLSGEGPGGVYGLLVSLDDGGAGQGAIAGAMAGELLASGLLSSGAARFVSFAPAPGAALAKTASAAGCRTAMAVSIAPAGEDRLSLSWTLVDSAGLKEGASGSSLATLPDASALAGPFWSALVAEAEDYLASGLPPLLLTVVGHPGTRFTEDGIHRVVPPGGSFTLELPAPGPLAWQATEEGAYPVSGRLEEAGVAQTRLRIPRRLWGVDIGAYGIAFPELRLVLALGKLAFARVGFVPFVIGASVSPNAPLPQAVSHPLLTPRLGLGLAFLRRSSDFRPYLALDASARISLADPRAAALDLLAPATIEPSLGLEWGRGPGFRLWGELGASIYPWAEPARLLAAMGGLPSNRLVLGGGPVAAGHPGWLAELPIVRLGLRLGI